MTKNSPSQKNRLLITLASLILAAQKGTTLARYGCWPLSLRGILAIIST
jgi:hypothetical protein